MRKLIQPLSFLFFDRIFVKAFIINKKNSLKSLKLLPFVCTNSWKISHHFTPFHSHLANRPQSNSLKLYKQETEKKRETKMINILKINVHTRKCWSNDGCKEKENENKEMEENFTWH